VLQELVRWIASGPTQHLSILAYDSYLAALTAGGQLEALGRQCPAVCHQIERVRARPPIGLLLNLAIVQGVSVLDILLRPQEAASRPLFGRFDESVGSSFTIQEAPDGAVKADAIARFLLAGDDLLLPSLEVLCERQGLNVGSFELYCRETYRAYRANTAAQHLRERYARQVVSRAFRLALRFATYDSSDVEALVAHLGAFARLEPEQVRRVAATTISIIRFEI